MGSDDLFRRKKKGANTLKRPRARRQPYDRVLIVTEGQKTEPNYLLEIVKRRELHTANVVVVGDCGSDPMSVVRYAKDRYQKERRLGEKFDRVYCVFDKDGHANFADATYAISQAKPKGVFHAITSIPCFEYWILLHFRYSTKPFQAPGGQSSCELLLKELKKDFPDYQKGEKGLYQSIEDKTGTAIRNAKKSLAEADSADTDNPSTRMHLLVGDLLNLKE